MSTDLRQLGISVVDSLAEGQSWDYELLLLQVDDERVTGRSEAADRLRVRLPRRIVVAGAEPVGPFEICARTKAALDRPSPKLDRQQALGRVIEVYDRWNRFLLRRRGLERVTLSIFFEDAEVARRWGSFEHVPDYLDRHLPKVSSSGDLTAEDHEVLAGAGTIAIWRHKTLAGLGQQRYGAGSLLQRMAAARTLYFQTATYSDAFFAHLFSSILAAEGAPDFDAAYLLRRVVETGLCRVLIVDERVAHAAVASARSEDWPNSLAATLAWMGVWVVGSIRLPGADGAIDLVPEDEHQLPVLSLAARAGGGLGVRLEHHPDAPGLPPAPDAFELLSIHQTILDDKLGPPLAKLLGEDGWRERWVLGLKPDLLWVCSHSGRGHPGRERLPANASFLEYSALQQHLISSPSKFFFLQMALATKQEEGR